MSQVVWVTGVAGFTGRHLVIFLKEQPEKLTIVGVDMLPSAPYELDAYHQIDLRNMAAIESLAETMPPNTVFHLAGLMPPKSEADMWQVNVGGTLNLIQALGLLKLAPRIVCLGSAAEYLPTKSGFISESDPCPGYSGYGRVKWGQTSLAIALGAQYGIDVMIARPFNLIGPGLPITLVAAQFCEQFTRKDGLEIKVGNTKSARDFIDIRDAVVAYWEVVRYGKPGEVYNVCTGIPTKISSLLDIFSELSGGTHQIVVHQDRLKAIDANSVYGSFDKLCTTSGWEPKISLKTALADMYNEAASEC